MGDPRPPSEDEEGGIPVYHVPLTFFEAAEVCLALQEHIKRVCDTDNRKKAIAILVRIDKFVGGGGTPLDDLLGDTCGDA